MLLHIFFSLPFVIAIQHYCFYSPFFFSCTYYVLTSQCIATINLNSRENWIYKILWKIVCPLHRLHNLIHEEKKLWTYGVYFFFYYKLVLLRNNVFELNASTTTTTTKWVQFRLPCHLHECDFHHYVAVSDKVKAQQNPCKVYISKSISTELCVDIVLSNYKRCQNQKWMKVRATQYSRYIIYVCCIRIDFETMTCVCMHVICMCIHEQLCACRSISSRQTLVSHASVCVCVFAKICFV